MLITNTSRGDIVYIIMARPKSMLPRAFNHHDAVVVLIRSLRSLTILQCCLNHESCVADVFGLSAKTNQLTDCSKELESTCAVWKVQQRFLTPSQLHHVRERKQSSFSSEFQGNR